MEYILRYIDSRNYSSTVNNLIIKTNPVSTKNVCLEIKTEKDNVLKLTLSKSEATAIVKSLSATLDGNCSATINPDY